MLEHLAVSNTPCISVVTLCNHVLWRSCSLLHRARKAKACARVWLDVYRGIEWVVIVSIVFERKSRSDEINTRVVFGDVMIQKIEWTVSPSPHLILKTHPYTKSSLPVHTTRLTSHHNTPTGGRPHGYAVRACSKLVQVTSCGAAKPIKTHPLLRPKATDNRSAWRERNEWNADVHKFSTTPANFRSASQRRGWSFRQWVRSGCGSCPTSQWAVGRSVSPPSNTCNLNPCQPPLHTSRLCPTLHDWHKNISTYASCINI